MNSHTAQRLRILVVENHPDTLEALKHYLQDCGHEVFTATTLQQAKLILPKSACSVLICDIGLPDGTGWDLANDLKLSGQNIFGIAMSGFGMNADSVRSKESGFRYHLLKPFKPAELDRILDEAVAPSDPV